MPNVQPAWVMKKQIKFIIIHDITFFSYQMNYSKQYNCTISIDLLNQNYVHVMKNRSNVPMIIR